MQFYIFFKMMFQYELIWAGNPTHNPLNPPGSDKNGAIP